MATARYVSLNGDIVPFDEGRVHVSSVAFKFGTAVFEGIRGYWNARDEQMYLFRMREHMARLAYSQRFMRFEGARSAEAMAADVVALLRANAFREDVHVMATVFVEGFGGPAVCGPIGTSVTAAPRSDIPFGESGCQVQVSAWQRVPDTAMPMRVKCNANYQNGRLAAVQARADGYDTALLLNGRGKVAEGPGMCFFMVRDGRAVTPTTSSDILESITRATVMELLADACGVEVVERDIDRSELAAADEAFFCGTAWEVTPVVGIDRLPVGAGTPGPVTRRLREAYFSVVRGETGDRQGWRTPVFG